MNPKKEVNYLFSLAQDQGIVLEIEKSLSIAKKFEVFNNFLKGKDLKKYSINFIVKNGLMLAIGQTLNYKDRQGGIEPLPLGICPYFCLNIETGRQHCCACGLSCTCLLPHFFPCSLRQEAGREKMRLEYKYGLSFLPWQ